MVTFSGRIKGMSSQGALSVFDALPEPLAGLLLQFIYDEGWRRPPHCSDYWVHPTKLTDGDPKQDYTYCGISLAEVLEGYGLDLDSEAADIKVTQFYFQKLSARLAK